MILDEIIQKVKENSKSIAYQIGEKRYTYGEFYKYVCNIYKLLLESSKKGPVIVYGHKQIYMKATFLACSCAGIAYVPIDESIPKDRIDLIIKEVKPEFIIGDYKSEKVENISEKQIENIMNNPQYDEIEKIYMEPENIYYIIFTSGSTGIPKGVKVTYKNLNSCVNWLKEIIKIEKGVILNQASFSFDLSVADLYLSLISGSEHFILEKQTQIDFKALFQKLKTSNSTIAVMTPSFADLLLLDKSFNEDLLPNLKTILFCGEKLLVSTVEKIYSRFKNITIINSYGPTECTFAVTSIDLNRKNLGDNISIGRPKEDVDILIVDEQLNKLEDGKVGEILILGESVADGYIGQESKSFIEFEGKKAYLTGDLGYKEKDLLYYKCRKDKQIKYKGYRIELSDIESNLCNLNYIQKAVVIPKTSKENKVTNIIAFVKLKENITKTEFQIKKELLDKIPEYMCPRIKILDTFPLNKNGKCDERKLLEEYQNGR